MFSAIEGYLNTPDMKVNLVAGLLIMLLELLLIFFLLNGLLERIQAAAERRRWLGARAIVLANITSAVHSISLLTLVAYRGFPWPPIGGYMSKVRSAVKDPAAIDFDMMCDVIPDLERDASALREQLGFYSSALPPDWFELVASALDHSHSIGRVANNMQVSRSFNLLRELPPLELSGAFDNEHFAILDALESVPDESLRARLLRRWVTALQNIVSLNRDAQSLIRKAERDVRRRMPTLRRGAFGVQAKELVELGEALEELLSGTMRAYEYYSGVKIDDSVIRDD
ncbi:MAG: hypothetical protein AAFX08_00490 [Pseudomonadota bacterium]